EQLQAESRVIDIRRIPDAKSLGGAPNAEDRQVAEGGLAPLGSDRVAHDLMCVNRRTRGQERQRGGKKRDHGANLPRASLRRSVAAANGKGLRPTACRAPRTTRG